jgi:hypothetical protein
MNSLIQKWLTGILALGAGYLVITNPQGVASAAAAFKNVTAGSVVSIDSGGKR